MRPSNDAASPAPQSRFKRHGVAFGLVFAIAVLGLAACHGCSGWIAHAVVDAPNAGQESITTIATPQAELTALGVSRELRVEVGPPQASLSVWVIDPIAGPEAANSHAPRGTVLVLHGIRDSKRSQVALGASLAMAGYRAVLVDLRGHGQSTGQWLTYGVVESHDLVQILDALETQGIVTDPIGVIGSSYGGAVAIQLAALDPRVKAVVAIACFTSLRDVIPHYVQHLGLGWMISQSTIDVGLRKAGALASFEVSQASPMAAIASMPTPVLLIHGANDSHIPADHSRALHEAALNHSELLIVDGADHVSVFTSDASGITYRCVDWLNRHLN